MARASIDLTDDAELELMKDDAIHRRAQENKRLGLEERRIAVVQTNAKTNQELMSVLLDKLG